MHAVTCVNGNTETTYLTMAGMEEIEKRVPHRNVMGTMTRLVNIVIAGRSLTKNPAATPRRENVKQDIKMHTTSRALRCMSLDMSMPRAMSTRLHMIPFRNPTVVLPITTDEGEIGHRTISSKLE